MSDTVSGAYEAEGSDPERNYLERYEMRDAEKIRDSSKKKMIMCRLHEKQLKHMLKNGKIAVPRQLPEEMRKNAGPLFRFMRMED